LQLVSFVAGNVVKSSNWPSNTGTSFAVPVAGYYYLTASVTWSANGVGLRLVGLGNAFLTVMYAIQSQIETAISTSPVSQSVSVAVYIAAGLSFSLNVGQVSGSVLTIGGVVGANDTTLSAHFLHP
jgi:hypothetical protein